NNLSAAFAQVGEFVLFCCRRYHKSFRVSKLFSAAVCRFNQNLFALNKHHHMAAVICFYLYVAVKVNAVYIVEMLGMSRQMNQGIALSFFNYLRFRDQFVFNTVTFALEIEVIESMIDINRARVPVQVKPQPV